ncbi:hypothetical protein EsH8_VII_000016 [Colletotrichum jinshuiense]
MALRQVTSSPSLKPDIRADTNRDGVVDVQGTSDVAAKAFWSAERGAIFLPNIGDKYRRCQKTDGAGNPWSNDELSSCHDASGHLLLAPEYVAPMRTLPMNVSSDATARIYATPQAAYSRVRIFLLDKPSNINATRVLAGISLGIDGRDLVKDLNVWDGSVTVVFEVTDGSQHASDAVALKMAPVLTHHHLQKVETLISTGSNDTDPIQSEFIRQLDERRHASGIKNSMLLFNQSSDIWAQDFIEPGYVSMPGPDGPIALRVILRSAQATRTAGRQVFEQLRGPGIGGFQPASNTGSGFGHREVNSYGNLETIPPYTSKSGVKYKTGRIIMGKHFDELPANALLNFLRGQEAQTPLILEAGWLLIGHVDEFVQFLPFDNELGFTVGIADTVSGIKMLQDLQTAGHGGVKAISYMPASDADREEPGQDMTIDEVLTNTSFVEANAYAQKHIDANLQALLAEIPLRPEQVVRIPTLFRDSNFDIGFSSGDGLPSHTSVLMANEKQLMAFYPASINGIVLGSNYISPKPFGPIVNGTDALAQLVEEAYRKVGMTVQYVDDYQSHHVGAGEVHCGSNTLRQTDLIWWH